MTLNGQNAYAITGYQKLFARGETFGSRVSSIDLYVFVSIDRR